MYTQKKSEPQKSQNLLNIRKIISLSKFVIFPNVNVCFELMLKEKASHQLHWLH